MKDKNEKKKKEEKNSTEKQQQVEGDEQRQGQGGSKQICRNKRKKIDMRDKVRRMKEM